MARAFSKWWDRRKVKHGNRFEADAGWKAGARWALAAAVERLGAGLRGRAPRQPDEEERERCIEELRELARELPADLPPK